MLNSSVLLIITWNIFIYSITIVALANFLKNTLANIEKNLDIVFIGNI
jgi:hypothetical protein